jgi:hypothetical protein
MTFVFGFCSHIQPLKDSTVENVPPTLCKISFPIGMDGCVSHRCQFSFSIRFTISIYGSTNLACLHGLRDVSTHGTMTCTFSQHALACRSPRINTPPPAAAVRHFIPLLIG